MENATIHIEMKPGYQIVRKTKGDKEIIILEPIRNNSWKGIAKLFISLLVVSAFLFLFFWTRPQPTGGTNDSAPIRTKTHNPFR